MGGTVPKVGLGGTDLKVEERGCWGINACIISLKQFDGRLFVFRC